MLSTVAIASTFVAAAAALPIASFVEVPEFIYNHTATSTSTFGNFSKSLPCLCFSPKASAIPSCPPSVDTAVSVSLGIREKGPCTAVHGSSGTCNISELTPACFPRSLAAMEYAISNGSCWDSKKTDLVVSIKVNQTDANVCGTQVNITNLDNGKSVLAQVVDECLDCAYDYLLLSPAAYSAVSSAKNFTASYTFSNYTEPASTSGSSGSSSSGKSGNASPDSKPAASSSSSQGKWTPAASPSSSSSTKKGSDSEWTSSSSKSEWTSSSKSESKPAPQTSSSKDDVKTTSTSQKYSTLTRLLIVASFPASWGLSRERRVDF